MNVLDLFSGIGGFSLGLERAGFNIAAFCEIEPYCQRVLKQCWPDIPVYNDIRIITKELLYENGITNIGLICGGYPCQGESLAGLRAGANDDRYLWPEMYRLIKDFKPRWVIAENVVGHISMGLDQTLSDLEAAGYTWWAFNIPACAVDARHERQRVWIVAYSESFGLQRVGDGRTLGSTQSDVAWSRFIRGGEQGGAYWPTEPDLGRVADGVPDRSHRLKGLGNAVVPVIPEIIGRMIMEVGNDVG